MDFMGLSVFFDVDDVLTSSLWTYRSRNFDLVDRDITLDIESFLESGGNVSRPGRLQRSRFALSSLSDRRLLSLPGRGRELFSERGGPLIYCCGHFLGW